MTRIELSDITHRLRRNLVASAFLIIIIVFAGITIQEASVSGLKLQGVNTSVTLTALMIFLGYHLLAFSLHAFEDFRLWRFELTNTVMAIDGKTLINLGFQMSSLADMFETLPGNSDVIIQQNQTIFSKADANRLKEASIGAIKYGKGVRNDQWVTGFRFFVWDIGTSVLLTVFSIYQGGSKLMELGCLLHC